MDAKDFWSRVKKLCKKRGRTLKWLSSELGFSDNAMTVKIQRQSLPDINMLERISELLSVPITYLISGEDFKVQNIQTGKEFSSGSCFLVPVLNQELSAGYGCIVPDSDEQIALMPVPIALKKYGSHIGILTVHGDSMEPTLHDGDLVICATEGYELREGIYAIRYKGLGYIKRIQVSTGGKLIIKSDNPLYSPFEEPAESEDIVLVGQVQFAIKRMAF